MNYAITFTVLTALFWWIGRWQLAYWRRFRFLRAEGLNPQKPISVTSYRQPRRKVRETRCYCKGRLWDVGEGPTDVPLRFRVTAECEDCHRIHVFHFDISKIPN